MVLNDGEERLQIDDESKALFSQTVTVLGKGEPRSLSQPNQRKRASEEESKTPIKKKQIINSVEKQPSSQTSIPATLGDIARVLRSKNAGPYEITFDIMFDNEGVFQLVKNANILDRTTVAKLLKVRDEDILWIGFFDQAHAFKATIPRMLRGKPVAGGGFMESDMHGAQQYLGLMTMKLSEGFIQAWKKEVGMIE